MRGLRMGDVAREAGVSPALLYRHFSGRHELIVGCFARASERTSPDAAPRSGGALERLAAAALAELGEHPAARENWVLWTELTAAGLTDPELARLVRDEYREWLDSTAALIREAQREGSVGAGIDPDLAAQRLVAATDGAGTLAVAGVVSHARGVDLIRAALASSLDVPQEALPAYE